MGSGGLRGFLRRRFFVAEDIRLCDKFIAEVSG